MRRRIQFGRGRKSDVDYASVRRSLAVLKPGRVFLSRVPRGEDRHVYRHRLRVGLRLTGFEFATVERSGKWYVAVRRLA